MRVRKEGFPLIKDWPCWFGRFSGIAIFHKRPQCRFAFSYRPNATLGPLCQRADTACQLWLLVHQMAHFSAHKDRKLASNVALLVHNVLLPEIQFANGRNQDNLRLSFHKWKPPGTNSCSVCTTKPAPGARYDLSSKRKERQLWKYDAKSGGYDLQSTCMIG